MAYTVVSHDEYGNPAVYQDENGNYISAWELKTKQYNDALNSSDPWTRLAAQQMGNPGGGNLADILSAFKPAQDFATQIGVDPAQAAASYGQGVTGNQGSSLFAGARDTLNQNLIPGWGMQQIAQDAGLLPQHQAWLQDYVNQGDQLKEQYNAKDSADSKAAMMKFGVGLAALATPGLMGMYPGQGTGLAFDPAAIGSEWNIPAYEISGGAMEPAAGAATSGGWSSNMAGADAIETLWNAGINEGLSATEVAAKYGFSSPEAFLGSINPNWVSSGGLLSGLLNRAGASGASSLVQSLLGGKENQALGALLGGILGSQNGSKQAGTTTVTQDPWIGQQPYLLDLFNRAANTQANAGTSPIYGAAQNQLMNTINGAYLNSNPYLDATFNQAANQVGAQIDSRFSRAGRYGSGAQQRLMGDTMSNLATNIYGQNYQQERTRQNAASLAGPGAADTITDSPYRNLQNYSTLIRGNFGGSTSSPYYTNPSAGILGGALAGSQLLRGF